MDEQEDENKLKFENELKKLKLSAEFGAKFLNEEADDIPPEIESQFLDNMRKFEEASENRVVKKVKDVLENPSFPPVDAINDEDISEILDKVYSLLNEHSINLDVIYEVPDRTIYKFIVEELFEHEMDVIDVPGMFSCFIYEEFCPNHLEDLKKDAQEFVEMLLEKRFEFMHMKLMNDVSFGTISKPKEAFVEIIAKQLSSIEPDLLEFNISSVDINENKATVTFQLKYEMTESGFTSQHDHEASLAFFCQYDYWTISGVNIPNLIS